MNKPVEEAIETFEANWRAESPPSISQAVQFFEAHDQRDVAIELAMVDMELRWRTTQQAVRPRDSLGAKPTWRDYCMYTPELGAIADLSPAAIAEEYRVRKWWGGQPLHDEFMSLYPEHFIKLLAPLKAIDREAAIEAPTRFRQAANEEPVSPLFDSRAPLPWTDYVLQEFAGAGGFGKVYRAEQKSLGRTVAVKALHKSRQNDLVAVELFLQEARLLARLNHPNIVGVHGLGRYPGGGYFLVLDFIAGENLQQRLQRLAIDRPHAMQIVSQTAAAISHAHELGVLHGDLKPANLMINPTGDAIVTDFGLGRLVADQSPIVGGGTLAFLAPEVANGEPISVASDIFSIGALLATLVGDSSDPPLAGVARIIAKCNSPKPNDRYQSVEEVIADLRLYE